MKESISLLRRFNTHRQRLSKSSRRWMTMTKQHQPFPTVSSSNHSDKIRNIGIIAHIDAGKTTVTEHLLFLTGTIPTIGGVDDGSTVTDFMDLERERGITIQSAAVTSNWADHRINLIDTPGHVDFTIEVERSLRVLDGSITVLDASAGVQAQTLTVWRQASKFNLPSVFFINKMDKPNADFGHSLSSIEHRLNSKIAPLILPVFPKNDINTLEGFVDVLSQKYLEFKHTTGKLDRLPKLGTNDWRDIQKNTRWEEVYLLGLEDLLIILADVDENFEKKLADISDTKIPTPELIKVIRRNTLKRTVCPLACGSALHSTPSVIPLLDMVVNFLPSPKDREYHISPEADVCAFVFKVRHDKHKGQLNYVRVYRGEIQQSQLSRTLVNANTGEHQTNFQLFVPFSDWLQASNAVDEGNIAVITGLKNTKTGDTLVNCTHVAHKSPREGHLDFETIAPSRHAPTKSISHLALEGIEAPSSVFSCTIEPPSAASELEFRKILAQLAVEDPSLRVKEDEETGQTIIEGMGELHIEVIKERLVREYGMKAFFGPLRVNYKEVPQKSTVSSERMEDVLNKKQWCEMKLKVEPVARIKEGSMVERFKGVVVELDTKGMDLSEVERAQLLFSQHPDYVKAINDGCSVAVHNGPLMGYPVVNLRVILREFSCSNRTLHPTLLSACANRCLTSALKTSDLQMHEPIMLMEVVLMSNSSVMPNPDIVIQELSGRRATILDVSVDSAKGRIAIIRATIPLAETQELSRTIRTITSGMANFHLQPHGYLPVETDLIREKM